MSVPRVPLTSAVAKHIRRLHRNSPVRAAAERMIAGEELGEAAISALNLAVHERSGRKWRERTVAAWCLGECTLNPDQSMRVSAGLRSVLVNEGFSNWSGVVWRSLGCSTVLASGLFTWWLVADGDLLGDRMTLSNDYLPAIITLIAILSVLLAIPIVIVSCHRDQAHCRMTMVEAARSLGKLADPFSVGVLARSQDHPCYALAQAAEEALTGALEAVREEHYGQLPVGATLTLCDALGEANHSNAQSILRALGCAGSGRGARQLRQLLSNPRKRASWEYVVRWNEGAKSPQAVEHKGEQSVLDAAEAVLHILEERFRTETAAERLLRPADRPDNAEQVLLRPAGSATSVPEEQLLRPAEAEEIVRVEHKL